MSTKLRLLRRALAILWLGITVELGFFVSLDAQTLGGAKFYSQGIAVVLAGAFATVRQNVPYSQPVQCIGGVAPITYAVTVGTLPTGLTLGSSTGVVSGTPTGTGTSAFTISCTDSSPTPVVAPFPLSLTVGTLSSIAITSASNSISVGATAQFSSIGTWTNGTQSMSGLVVWTSGTPATATIGSASGTATGVAAGTTNITAAFNSVTSNTFVLTASVAIPDIDQTTLPLNPGGTANCQLQIPCPAFQLTATAGTPPYTWTVSAGALPAGMSLSAAGLLAGAPTASGSFSWTAQVTDSGSNTDTQAFTLVVAIPSSNTVTPASPSIQQGQSNQFQTVITYNDGSAATIMNGTVGAGFVTVNTAQGGDKSASSHSSTTTALGSGNVTGSGPLNVIGGTGHSLIVVCGISDNTPTMNVPTDTGLDTFTSVVGPVINANQPLRLQIFKADTVAANAAEIFTCPLSASTTGFTDVMAWEVSGTASPSPDQNSSASDATASQTITSGAITPTIPNTMALVAGWMAGSGRAFTPGGGCMLLVTDSIGRGALEACSIAGTAATTESMTFNISTRDWDGAIVNLKPTAGGTGLVWSATDLSGSGVATIGATGLAFGSGVGTSTITATIGAVNASTVLTVTTGTGGAITVTPATASVTVGRTQQFRCSNGNDITPTAKWSTKDITGTNVATVGNGGTGGLATAVNPGQASILCTFP